MMTPWPHLPQSKVGFGCFLDSFQSGARSNSMIGVGSASDLAVIINPHVDMLQHLPVAKLKFSVGLVFIFDI